MSHVLFPGLLRYADVGLLLLRLMVAAVFFTSGLSHVRDPAGRGRSIGQSPRFTFVIGCVEIAGSLGVALGILTQGSSIGLILVMLGAIQKKIFVWKTGFWGEKNSGWHYDLMMILMNLVILTTAAAGTCSSSLSTRRDQGGEQQTAWTDANRRLRDLKPRVHILRDSLTDGSRRA